MALVGVVMGSKSDADVMQETLDTLVKLGISYEVSVLSAHRNPEKVREYGMSACHKGLEVIIAGAGRAAHLAGVLAAWTTLPVIGVPLPDKELGGLDAQLSIICMPGGVPVAGMPLGSAGARNAAIFAAAILALKYDDIRKVYEQYRKELQEK